MRPTPVVSVVTPAYNGAEFLDECIQSVLKQSYQDWEYVILDNRSTDDTARIAEGYAARDPRIRVVRAADFASLWGNHNRALKAIAPGSRYCKILHADDLLYPECLERMVAVADAHPSVGIVSSYRLVGKSVEHDGLLSLGEDVMAGREAVRRILLHATPPWPDLGWVTGSPTSLLVRTDFLRGRPDFYDETLWHADPDAALRVLTHSDLGFVHQILTYTRLHAKSMTPVSYRVNTFLAEQGRLLARHGPTALAAGEYRANMRRWMRQYAWLIVKQTAKLSHYRHQGFREFHERNVAAALAEAGDDRELRATLLLCQAVLRIPPRFRAGASANQAG